MTKIKYLGFLLGLLSLPIYAAEPAEMVKNVQKSGYRWTVSGW